MAWISGASLLLGLLLAGAAAWYLRRKHVHIWLPRYVAAKLKPLERPAHAPTHVVFLFVDHFELAGRPERLNAWLTGYPPLARRHVDSDGFHPRHTWFYALDLMHEHELEALSTLVDAQLGELELHWHHAGDTAGSFTRKLRAAMEVFHRHGYMRPYRPDRPACFGFIHGNWSLDNARGSQFCGVDDEIEVLLREGCYGDFTFPALFNEAQPREPNRIDYAREDGRPKSYDRGRPAVVGTTPGDDELMIFQGPLCINWRDWRFRWHPAFEDGDVNRGASHHDPRRIDAWVRQGIHVAGRPEWVFVKVFCHGAQDHEAVLGEATDRMFDYLESRYNDGRDYRLHYVTAREAYNIVRAAEDGRTGSPGDYRDYVIPPPAQRAHAPLAHRRSAG